MVQSELCALRSQSVMSSPQDSVSETKQRKRTRGRKPSLDKLLPDVNDSDQLSVGDSRKKARVTHSPKKMPSSSPAARSTSSFLLQVKSTSRSMLSIMVCCSLITMFVNVCKFHFASFPNFDSLAQIMVAKAMHSNEDGIPSLLQREPGPKVSTRYAKENIDHGFLSNLDSAFFRELQRSVDQDDDAERCERYGFGYNAARPAARRIFYGALIASEPWEIFEVVAAESHGIFAGMVFVESNRTQAFHERNFTRLHHTKTFQRLFGVDNVQIRAYVDENENLLHLDREHQQREEILKGWKEMGMMPTDIGFLTDADEMFSRDVLRAVQVCEIDNLDYEKNKCHHKNIGIRGHTQVFESSPECVTDGRAWYHPSMIPGHCIEGIGDESRNPRAPRQGTSFLRADGYGYNGTKKLDEIMDGRYPLYSAADFRRLRGAKVIQIDTSKHPEFSPYSAFHFHNFFTSPDAIRFKHRTYGHANKYAYSKQLKDLSNDLALASRCVQKLERPPEAKYNHVRRGYDALKVNRPIYFRDPIYRRRRHEFIKNMILQDEKEFQQARISQPPPRKIFIYVGVNCGKSYYKVKDEKLNGGYGWEIYLWEANPQMIKFFLNDLARKEPNVVIIPKAAAAKSGKIQLFLTKGQEDVNTKADFSENGKCDPKSAYSPSGSSTVLKSAKRAGKSIEVEAVDFIAWLRKLNVKETDQLIVQMDIEGAELEILKAMLSTGRDVLCRMNTLIVEWHKTIFQKDTEEYKLHEEFEIAFPTEYKLACGKEFQTGGLQVPSSISRPNKYLKYGSTSGWSNQLLSLEHAIWFADASKRTLVLPPMLPQNKKTQRSYVGSTIDAEYENITDYIPMTEVLEFDWSGLSVVDWSVFHQGVKSQNLSETELSYKYHCGNTKWTRNLTAFPKDNLTQIHYCKDHLGRTGFHNVTYRDMVTTLEQFDSYDVLNFHFIFPESGFDTAHQHPTFNLTYTEPIRSVAKSIRQKLWGDEPYASIHLRTRDGPYRSIFQENATGVIRDALTMVGSDIERYYSEKNLSNITLLVVTDFKGIRHHPSWLNESAKIMRSMADKGISISFRFGSDFVEQVEELKTSISNPFADICVDMQLAACATIGFGYSETNSTFLKRIRAMRMQPPVC